jgi:hypothetical protein
MVVLGDDGQVEACFGTVCTERTIGLEIILDAPDRTSRRCGSSGILF